jgi:dimethylhistidine N-methyltransferase
MSSNPADSAVIFPAHHPERDSVGDFRADVLKGLSARPKTLPSKYLYDEIGSGLFEKICELPEYYLTRTELKLLRRHGAEMAAMIGRDCLLIEYGIGSGLKTRLLLGHLTDPVAYVPVDVAHPQLRESAATIRRDFPHIVVRPVCADFTTFSRLPDVGASSARRVVYFPGSTIGNFTRPEARQLLARAALLCGPNGGLLLGVDLKKHPQILEKAYNDRQSVTAAFNLNALARVNRELQATFRPDQFWHYAPYNPRHGRVEMHLVSRSDQQVQVAGENFSLAEGESICTEYCHKYSLRDLHELTRGTGFTIERTWLDENKYFSVSYLAVRRR